MANEIQVQFTVQIKKNNQDWRNTINQFKDDLVGDGTGPTPAAITATTDGVDVDLSELTTPGQCVIENIGSNTVHFGLHDGAAFRPLGQVKAGKACFYEFSSLFGKTLDDTGTGTADTGTDTLRVLAENADTPIRVGVFEA